MDTGLANDIVCVEVCNHVSDNSVDNCKFVPTSGLIDSNVSRTYQLPTRILTHPNRFEGKLPPRVSPNMQWILFKTKNDTHILHKNHKVFVMKSEKV